MSAGSYAPFLLQTPKLWPPAIRGTVAASSTVTARLGLRTPVRATSAGSSSVTARPPRRTESVGTSSVSGSMRGTGRLVAQSITGEAVVDATVTPTAGMLATDAWLYEDYYVDSGYSANQLIQGAWVAYYEGRAEYLFNETLNSDSTFPTAWRALQKDDSTNTTNSFTSAPGGFVGVSNRAAGDIVLSGTNYGGDSQAAPVWLTMGLAPLLTPGSLTPGRIDYHYYLGYGGFSSTSGRTRPNVLSREVHFILMEKNSLGALVTIADYTAAKPSGWNVTAVEDVGNDSFHVKASITIPTTDLAKITRWDQLYLRVLFKTVQPSVGTDTDVDLQLQNSTVTLPGKFIKGLKGSITGNGSVSNPNLLRQKGAKPAGSATVTGDMRRRKRLNATVIGTSSVSNQTPLYTGRFAARPIGTSSVLVRFNPRMRTSVLGAATVLARVTPRRFAARVYTEALTRARISIAGFQAAFPADVLASYRWFDENNFGASVGGFGGTKGYPYPPFGADNDYNWGLNNAGEALAVYDAYMGTWSVNGSQYVTQPLRNPSQIPETGITVFARCRTNQNTNSMYFRFTLYERRASGDVLIGGNFNDTTGSPRYNGVLVGAGGTVPGAWVNITEVITKAQLLQIQDWSKLFVRLEAKSGAFFQGGGELDVAYFYMIVPGSPNVALKATILLPDGHFVDSNNTNVPNVAGNMTVAARRRALAGAPAGSATASVATAKKRLAMTGHAYGVAQGYDTQTVTGDLTRTTATGGVQRDLSVTVVGTSTVTAAAKVAKQLAATPAGAATTTGVLGRNARANALAATVVAQGTVSANATRFRIVQLASQLFAGVTFMRGRLTVSAGSTAPRITRYSEGSDPNRTRVRAGRRISR